MKNDLRCLCGLLVAKVQEGGIELKCRRCKRFVIIPFKKKEEHGANRMGHLKGGGDRLTLDPFILKEEVSNEEDDPIVRFDHHDCPYSC